MAVCLVTEGRTDGRDEVVTRDGAFGGGSRSNLTDMLHDLNQPLTAIRALAAAPPGACGTSQDTDELRRRLRQIHALGEWMNDLLSNGSAAEPDSRRPGTSDVAHVVQDVVLATAASFQGRLRWRPCGPALVAVDSLELRRALGNVLDNAIRAAGPAGRVDVRARLSGRRVRVEVEDNGPGFGRLPHQTGRGMAAAQRMLGRCGGVLEISAGRAGGALVGLDLPRVAAETSA
jgi:C4-dicarboxylate-specific signal transduction histidine kinase